MSAVSGWIPRVPLTMNKLLRSHWRDRQRDGATWRVAVLSVLGAPPATWRPHRVSVSVTVHRGARQDPDNRVGSLKPLIDALVTLGWLADDTDEHVTLEVQERVERKARERGTLVVLRELG